MKRRILMFLCLTCILLSLLAFPVGAETSGECGDNATWSLSGGVLTISGSGAIRDYIYEGANLWPDIKAPWREYSSSITKIVINSGITRIGDNAFCCLPNVTSVSIPGTVTYIGQAAFCDDKSLTNVTIPNSVTTLEQSVFKRCKKLTSITLSSNLKRLGGGTFEDCHALKSISLPSGLTEIESWTFASCAALKSITIPSGVTEIQASAFAYSGLTGITLPGSLKEIHPRAFNSCNSLAQITIPASVSYIGQDCFHQCYHLSSVRFTGSAPSMDSEIFCLITTTAYYPRDNSTWTESVRHDYGGTVTWVAYCGSSHSWGEWTTQRQATCAKEGLKVRACTKCDVAEEEIIAKPPHQYTAQVTPPTCKADGYTTHTCTVCGDSYHDSKTLAGPHVFGEWVTEKEATCLETGSRQRTCSECQTQEAEELPITDHAYQDEVTPPSCTESGHTTHTCTVCADTYTDAETPPVGHDYLIEVEIPTCIEGGYTTHTCMVCSDTFTDSFTDPAGHSYSDWIETSRASWFSEGEQYRKCTNCPSEETQVIPKVPVNWGVVIAVSAGVIALAAGSVILIKKRAKK